MKKLATILFSAISIFSLIYFTVKYYLKGQLLFDSSESNVFVWTFLVAVIVVSLILGIVNTCQLQTVKHQNSELICLVVKMLDGNEEVLTTIFNSREIELDIYNAVKKNEEGDKLDDDELVQ